MAQDTFTHQGVVYRDLGDGQVEVVGYAQAPGGVVVKEADPYAAPLKQQQLAKGNIEISNAQGAEASRDLDNEIKRLTIEAKRNEMATGGKAMESDDKRKAKMASLESLVSQINRVQSLYEGSIAKTSGIIGGWADFLPTEANRQFDTAAAGLAEQGLSAFRVPGVGAQSDTELRQFVQANKPSASDYDSSIEEKLLQLRTRVDATRQQMGLPPAQWGSQATPPGAPGAAPPPGPDRREAVIGGPQLPGGGGPPAPGADQTTKFYVNAAMDTPDQASIAQGGFRSERDPLLVGGAKRLASMLASGASDEDIRAAAAELNANPASVEANIQFRRQNPNYKGGYNTESLQFRQVPIGGVQQMFNDVGAGPVGAFGLAAGDAATFGTLDNMADDPAVARAIMQGSREMNPTASLAGTISGGVPTAMLAEAGAAAAGAKLGTSLLSRMVGSPRTADALYGAASGAGAADEGDRLTGGVLGGIAGLGGGIAGRGIARGAGNAATGVRNESVQYLRDRGIPTTVGQTLGGIPKLFEDRLSSVPIIGDLINARRREGIAALRPAAVGEAVEEIPNNLAATVGLPNRDVLEIGRQAVGSAYDTALGGVDLTVDPSYRSDLGAALMRSRSLPEPLRDVFDSTLTNRVAPMFNGQNLSGRNLQGAIQGLRKDAGALIKRDEVQSDLFKDRTVDVEEALFNLAERQAPGTPEALQLANSANRRMSIIEDASARALNNEGDFTANQLGQAIKSNASRFNGTRAMNSGQAPLQHLQEAAQNVLPSSIPDSGTSGRLAMMALPAALGGAGGGLDLATDGGGGSAVGGLSIGALLSLGGTRNGQRFLSMLLADRPDILSRLGGQINNNAAIGGVIGAPTALQLLPAN
ncbi:MAG: hypothetical protein WC889_02785 [Myxococcota bacterium]|jgi:hypothetical protein